MTANSNYKSAAAYELATANYERTTADWPVPVEEIRLPTGFGDTFVLAFGDPASPALVLLHGSAANSSTWAGEAAAYAQHFRVYAIDLPGETGKSTANRPPYAGSTYAEWLCEAMNGLRLERVYMVGLSLGAWAAMKFAAAAPERVERLALIAPGGLARAKKSFILKAAIYLPFGMWGIRRITQLVFSPQPPPPGADEAFAFGLRNYNARRDTLPLLSDAELTSLKMPVIFIGGDSDALLDTAAGAERLRRFVPHAEVRILPEAGHALLGIGEEISALLSGPPRQSEDPQ